MLLNDSEMATARSRPQSTELNISVFQPNIVLQCRTNFATGTARGAIVINYDTVTAGSYLSVEAGMTMWVGTTSGAKDTGRVRVRSITSSQITVSENSDIVWKDDMYLTVYRLWEVWPVYPRIISDPADDTDVVFYKDYDIAYTNQNAILGAFICAGPHRAAWAGERLYYSASGTSHVAGSSMTYNWAFEGGSSITGSSSHTPGYVRYDTPGHYVTRLIVTGVNGSIDTTYRYVSIYNKPANSAASNPPKNWSMQSFGGSRGEGGYRGSIKLIDDNENIADGLAVVLWADDWYGSTNISLGGNGTNTSKIFFSGHIVDGTIRINSKSSSIEFDIGNISEIMKLSQTFVVSLESKNSAAAKWFQMEELKSKKAIYHYLRWHSTVLSLADFEYVGANHPIQYFDSDRTSIFDSIDDYMRNTELGAVVSDRQGKLYANAGVPTYTNPVASLDPAMTIVRGDWIGEPAIQENLFNSTSSVDAGGIMFDVYDGTSGTSRAFLARAPGVTHGNRGTDYSVQKLAVDSQENLNRISGHVYANMNVPYPQIDINMSSGFRNLDIAPLESIQMDVASTDISLGVAIQSPFIVDGINWSYDSRNKTLYPDLTLIQLVNGFPGETILMPNIPTDDGGGGGDPTEGGWEESVAWGTLGTAVGDDFAIFAFAWNADKTKLYVGSNYSQSVGTLANANSIACFEPVSGTWSALGTGLSQGGTPGGLVHTIAVAPNGDVYVGGFFDKAGGVSVKNIAMWDGSWHAILPFDADGEVYSIIVHPISGDVYVGGTFIGPLGDLGNIPPAPIVPSHSDHFARWSPSTLDWHDIVNHNIGQGYGSNHIFSMTVDPSTGDLYIGGTQMWLQDSQVGTEYMLTKWVYGATGLSGLAAIISGGNQVNSVDFLDRKLLVGGDFVNFDGVTGLTDIAQSTDNGATFSDVGGGLGAGTVTAVKISDSGYIYVGGTFTTPVAKFIEFDGNDWVQVGKATDDFNYQVLTIAIKTTSGEDELFVGGYFNFIGSLTTNYKARYPVRTWTWNPNL